MPRVPAANLQAAIDAIAHVLSIMRPSKYGPQHTDPMVDCEQCHSTYTDGEDDDD